MGFGLRDFDLRGGRAAFEAGSLVEDLGSGVWVLRVGVSKFGRGLWFGVQGPGSRGLGSGFRVQGSGFRVQGFGCRIDRPVGTGGARAPIGCNAPPTDLLCPRQPLHNPVNIRQTSKSVNLRRNLESTLDTEC